MISRETSFLNTICWANWCPVGTAHRLSLASTVRLPQLGGDVWQAVCWAWAVSLVHLKCNHFRNWIWTKLNKQQCMSLSKHGSSLLSLLLLQCQHFRNYIWTSWSTYNGIRQWKMLKYGLVFVERKLCVAPSLYSIDYHHFKIYIWTHFMENVSIKFYRQCPFKSIVFI